jgi:hypothetical protein
MKRTEALALTVARCNEWMARELENTELLLLDHGATAEELEAAIGPGGYLRAMHCASRNEQIAEVALWLAVATTRCIEKNSLVGLEPKMDTGPSTISSVAVAVALAADAVVLAAASAAVLRRPQANRRRAKSFPELLKRRQG